MRRAIPEKKMLYFIPWWDDYVSKDYDFIDDRPVTDQKVTMHHIFADSPYDGILVSKVKIEENKKNMKRIQEQGIHSYLEFEGPIFGDCGAYGYIDEKQPPFSPTEIAEYYNTIGFDFGVSVDHLIVKAVEDEKHERFEITIKNAERFKKVHEKKGYEFIPVGAAQGWDPQSYTDSVEQLIDIGYEYIAVGGLTRSQTPEILRVLRAIHEKVKERGKDIKLHLFGVARLNAMKQFYQLGITSFDSASHLRRAWLGASSNYILPKGRGYAALRVPQTDRSRRARDILESGHLTEEELEEIEQSCMSLIRKYDNDDADEDEVLQAILWYDSLMGDNRDHASVYEKTLRDTPWKECSCEICSEVGIEVIVFRGNNRNRRRGFHNTRVFFNELQEILKTADEVDPQTNLEEF